MNNLIVVVEVSLNIEKDVKNILGSIIDFSNVCFLTNTSFIYHTDQTPVDVRDILIAFDEFSSVFVCVVETPAAWKGIKSDKADLSRMFNED